MALAAEAAAQDEGDFELNELESNELSGLQGEIGEMDQLAPEIVEGDFNGMASPRMVIDKSHAAKIDVEERKQAQASVSAPATSVDGALIKAIWPYVRCGDRLPGDGMLKNEGTELA